MFITKVPHFIPFRSTTCRFRATGHFDFLLITTMTLSRRVHHCHQLLPPVLANRHHKNGCIMKESSIPGSLIDWHKRALLPLYTPCQPTLSQKIVQCSTQHIWETPKTYVRKYCCFQKIKTVHSELLCGFRYAQHASDVCAVLIRDRSPHPPPETKTYFLATVPTAKKFDR